MSTKPGGKSSGRWQKCKPSWIGLSNVNTTE